MFLIKHVAMRDIYSVKLSFSKQLREVLAVTEHILSCFLLINK